MKSNLFTLILCFCSAFLIGQTTLINNGSSWSYYDNQNEPSDQGGEDWNDLNYDASSWNTGNAQLGYGDGDETTTLNSNTLTAYFRKDFNVSNPAAYNNLDLNLTYDDGAVVYLNGTEVWRVNMPGGTITYNTFSAAQSSDNQQGSQNVTNTLVAGNNTIAVEIHQRSASSSDLSFDFQLVGNAPGAVSVTRGPYLQKASPTSVVIRWRTQSSTESIVDYGTSLGNLNQQVSNLTPKTEHEITLTGLSANTVYYYQISNSAAVLVAEASDVYFKTHPNSGSTQPIRFWALGDCGTANSDQRAVRDAYYSYASGSHTDGILFLGDNAYNSGTDNEYQYAVFENMYENILKNTIAWSCLGNHDGYSANSGSQTGPYYDIFTFPTAGESGGIPSGTEAYYSFDYGNVHFISLDSYDSDRSVGGAMYNWCVNDIQNTTQDWIITYFHHPPYTKGSHDSDSESNLIDMRENFLPMLENNGVDLVLSGHSHSYERSYFLNGHYGNSNSFDSNTHTVGAFGSGDGQSDGTGSYAKTITGPDAGEGAVYITAGSSGKVSGGSLDHEAMYYSVSSLGSCVVEINGNQLDLKFVRETGAIDDYFTILKSDPNCPAAGTPCDDGDSNTVNDVEDGYCNCAGVVCDPAGTVCDDGNPSTYNDIEDGNCNCTGTPCPTAGTACDDGNPNTINDVEDGNCNCAGTPTGSTVCVSINSGNDDVEEHGTNGTIYTTSSDIELVYDDYQSAGNQIVGLRFNNVAVPQGAVITAAYLQFTTDETNSGTTNLTIYGEDSDNAAAFTTSTYNVSSRTTTSASVSWNPAAWNTVGESGPNQKSTNISGIISEIVNRPGYNINNSIAIIITGTGERTAESYNGSSSQAAELCITYTLCPSAGSTCDDGDPSTYNDVEDGNCNCAGTPCLSAGTACDDGDASTYNDVEDGNCNCTGTPCPSAGTICDDGDPNTINDVEDGNCNCAGEICDPIGTACDDGDPSTYNDVEDGNCNCAGTPCPTAGTSCDDGDASTYNDVEDGNCNCTGTPCPSAGTSCDDGDPNTVNDVEDGFCNCAGEICDPIGTSCDDGDPSTYNDVEDGFCNCDGTPCPTAGTVCDDGDASTFNDVEDGNCNCTGTPCPTAGTACDDGDASTYNDVEDGNCNCTGTPCPSAGTACDDGNASTYNDVEDGNCNCAGTPCPTAGTACDDGDASTFNDVEDGFCNCAGTPCPSAGTTCDDGDASTYNDVEDGNCNCSGTPCPTVGTACDDGNPNTINDVEDGNCNCAGTPSGSTVCVSINSGDDDVEEHGTNGAIYTTSSDIELVYDDYQSAGNQIVGLRFNNVAVPQGAVITAAHLQFTTDETNSGTTNLTIYGEDTDNAAAFTTSTYNVSNRTVTAASVSWNPAAWNTVGESGPNQQSTDISGIISEIVNRPGYDLNNSIAIIITGTGERTAESYNGSSSQAAELCITYTLCPAAGTTCDDGNPNTVNDVEDGNCNCAGEICDPIGTACDDGDPSTYNDIEDGFCNCAGTPCPTAGTSCDDGDASTYNDIEDGNCNCTGTPCPSAGTACDDGNASTYNDIEDGNCNCAGTPCPSAGTACDDGNASTYNDIEDGNCNCAGTPCPSAGTACDDGNASTYNDVEDGNCNCTGSPCPTAGTSCDDGNASTYNDIEDGNCNCAGTPCPTAGTSCDDGDASTYNDIEDGNCNCTGTPCPTAGTACDDGNPNTVNDVEDGNCNCEGEICDPSGTACDDGDPSTYNDIEDGFCNCAGTPCPTAGTSCDDGDASTYNDIEDGNCNCTGTPCPSAGTACDDGDASTYNDMEDGNCNCAGTPCPTAGTTCDDGNASTYNDIEDGNCNCAGTPCPSAGTACDDGNPITVNDVEDGNCNCAGEICDPIGTACDDGDPSTYNDVEDGFCNCDGIPCPTAGTACDDGDASTYNDVEDGNCNCTGTPCPTAGTSCDDGDASTYNDVEDGNCNCAGTPCPTAGTTCDDGNASTYNDVEDGNCNCEGTPCPTAGTSCDDGDASTFNDIEDGNCNCAGTPCPTAGTACDDGDASTYNDIEDGNCNCSGTPCPTAGTACDDGDASTFNDIEDGNCNCAGTPCPTAGTACDDGDASTYNDIEDGNCNCTGTPCPTAGTACDDGDASTFNDVEDGFCNCSGTPCPTAGTACDDGDPNTVNDVEDGNCNCTGTPIITCEDVTLTIILDNYPEETSWTLVDDNNVAIASGGTYGSQPDGSTIIEVFCLDDGCYDFTINDAYGDGICCGYGNGSYLITDSNNNVLASGGSFASSETTNFCIGACPAAGTACDDGDPNTTNDIEDGNCNCVGTPIGGCTTVEIDNNNFESGWGIWNDGGSDARRSSNDAAYAIGTYCIRLRDDTSSSVMTTDNMDLSAYDELTIDFSYYPRSMDNSNEDFWLQVSTNGGSSYVTVEEWNKDDEFVNDIRYYDQVVINGPFTSTTRLRFRCDASGNSDWIYIDEVVISSCIPSAIVGIFNADQSYMSGDVDILNSIIRKDEVTDNIYNVYPNPALEQVHIELIDGEPLTTKIQLIDVNGKVKLDTSMEGRKETLNLDGIEAGVYNLQIITGSQVRHSQRLVVIR